MAAEATHPHGYSWGRGEISICIHSQHLEDYLKLMQALSLSRDPSNADSLLFLQSYKHFFISFNMG